MDSEFALISHQPPLFFQQMFSLIRMSYLWSV